MTSTPTRARAARLSAYVAERDARPLVVALLALVLAAGVVALAPGSVDRAQAAPVLTRAAAPGAASDGPAYKKTRTLTRVFENADGSTTTALSADVTVKVSETRNLRGRQRVHVSWSGAKPSGGRAANPYGINGLQQEYPVVIMQCRGIDGKGVAKRDRLRPETCWTSSIAQRSQIQRSASEAAWTRDLYNDEADKQRVSGLDPFPSDEECPGADTAPYYTHLTEFVAKKEQKVFPACDVDSMPPEAAVEGAFPPNELSAFTDLDGNGDVQFEVRSDAENESLGCNFKTKCSIVVIPIMGISCQAASSPPSLEDQACRRTGRFAPGSNNFANEGAQQAVSPSLWWSESNWRNRFSVPITFGLPPDRCDILDPRPPTAFYGTELMAQAALQWTPAYCLNEDRFKFQLNTTSDIQGFDLMQTGLGAALISSRKQPDTPMKIGYAPTAVTGFSIGYVIDRPNNAGEYTDLRLNPRLIAKLLTQSYLGSDLGRDHPGMGDNPLSLLVDPEFQELNPDLSTTSQEAAATLLSLSNDSDIIHQLTDYISRDKAAMDFIGGKADPWGMVVNPNYEDLDVPRESWPLLDKYIPKTENTCRQENPAVYFSQLAAPVTTLRVIAEALIDAWPNVQTRCEFDQSTQLYKLGRIDRQNYGARFMLGLVSLGDADRFGLRSAALETSKGTYVAPTDKSMSAAVRLMRQEGGEYGPYELSQAEVRREGSAYPGTMPVFTSSRLQGVEQDIADKTAEFIRIATTEGQQPGNGNGQLPGGYLPIKRTGVTAKLFDTAQVVADAIQEQKEPNGPQPSDSTSSDPSDDPSDTESTDGTSTPAGPGGTSSLPGDLPTSADSPSGAPSDDVSDAPGDDEPALVSMPDTESTSSGWAGGLLPALLILGLVGAAVASGLRFFVQPPRGGGG